MLMIYSDPTFDIRQYDFVCVGSGLRAHLPYNEILNLLRGFRTRLDPRIVLHNRDETIQYINEPVPEIPLDRKPAIDHNKEIIFNACSKFCPRTS
jgi:hypothetical protein